MRSETNWHAENAMKITVTQATGATRFALRCRPNDSVGLGEATGWTLGLPVLRGARTGDRAVLRLSPDEWQLMGSLASQLTIVSEFAAASAQCVHSLVEITDRQRALLIEGHDAAELLATGCPLDFDLAAMPVGFASRTLMWKIEIILWRQEVKLYHIEYGRSYEQPISHLLLNAAKGL